MKIYFCLMMVFVLFGVTRGYPQSRVMLTNFRLQSSAIIHQKGALLSTADYKPDHNWFPVKVPSTVLTGLVANQVYPDPHLRLNNMHIPDASDSTNEAYHLSQYSYLPNQRNPWKDPYWYRTTFKVPQNYAAKHIQLHFKGINYRAAVWLNGHQLADSTDMAGMFRQYRFDVTDFLRKDSTNYLAVKIYPLDYPGLPSPPQLQALGPFFANGGPTGDIGKNVTMLCSIGWDWMPAVRDRNMGIWQPVFLSASGPVTVDEPQIITELPDLPDATRAGLDISVKLTNHSDTTQNGTLGVSIRPENFTGPTIQFSRHQTLKAGHARFVALTYKDIDRLNLAYPKLWWPNGYGRPNLYQMELRYSINGEISQATNVTFGIRTVSSRIEDVDGWARRDFYVNGKNIKLTGGAWVPDMMLQRDSLRYEQEMSLIQNANLNTVRIWGGGIAPPDVFYDEADRKGLLVWQDFWITGDTNGEFKGSPDWPLQGDVFIDNMRSTIKRVRNHPSLLVWTGGNEGHARKTLYDAMRRSVANLDGTRPFLPSSSGFAKLPQGWQGSWPGNQQSGVYSGGPYSWQPPETYYQRVEKGRDWIWKDETGMPSQPAFSSLPKIIPDLVPDTTKPYPLNNTWGYHDAASGNGKYDTYYQAIKDRYGSAKSYKDYSDKAQLANANGYRAIFESVGSKLSETGGVLLWKLNAAFPSVMWQLYDWYLNPNAGYYFTKKAVEPLHVQLNLDDSTVAVVNRQFQDQKKLSVIIRFYNSRLQQQFEKTVHADAPAQQATTIDSLALQLKSRDNLTFVGLTLTNSRGKIITHNVYWLQPDDNFHALQNLPGSALKITRIKPIDESGDAWSITIENPTDKLAFFIHAQITTDDGEELLPSYWSDNYLSIAPHATATLTVRVRDAPHIHQLLNISLESWNGKTKIIPLNTR